MKTCTLYNTFFLLSEYINEKVHEHNIEPNRIISTGAYSYYATFPFEQEVWAQFY